MNTHVFTTTNEQPTLLSKKGMKELKKRITQLEHDQSVLIRSLHEMERTNTHDERLERIERLAQLESIESELFDKKSILEHAKLLPTRRARMKVALGSVVDLIDQQGKLMRFTLVDSIEANPSDGRISVASPLGSQLVGKSVTDTVEWDAKMKHRRMQLINIH